MSVQLVQAAAVEAVAMAGSPRTVWIVWFVRDAFVVAASKARAYLPALGKLRLANCEGGAVRRRGMRMEEVVYI